MTNYIGSKEWFKEDAGAALWLKIPRRLPSLNDYISKNRSNAYAGAKFKKNIDEGIKYDILLSANVGYLRPIKPDEYPVTIEIYWREENAKRDVDNIKSAAKYILDALVEMHILKNDGQKYVAQVYDRITVDGERGACVFVKIIPNAGQARCGNEVLQQ
jgi:Holliday junction resolvase RusA-like endonuclease